MDYKTILEKIKNDSNLLNKICDYSQIYKKLITFANDTSHSINDIRINFYIKKDWVIKITSKNDITNEFIFEVSKVIENYNNSGIYAPKFVRSSSDDYLYEFCFEGLEFVAWVEQYAPYEVSNFNEYADRIKIEALEKTARYMILNTNKDLMTRKSMWSIIELADWDKDIDEKEKNYHLLRSSLLSIHQFDLIHRIDELNNQCRRRIQ